MEQENYLLVDGLHEAIVSEGLWHEAQVKLLAQAKKYEKVNNGKDNKVHLLTGLLKCPICGAGMYGNKSIKHKPDGTKSVSYTHLIVFSVGDIGHTQEKVGGHIEHPGNADNVFIANLICLSGQKTAE